ncbi:kinase-like domain-containing protein [Trametes maxima]|nr:kinase-like domain-containing protein [Trametes maxima]
MASTQPGSSTVARGFMQLPPSDVQCPGYGQCAAIEETFSVQSVHGKHFCVVTELCGPSLSSLVGMQPNGRLPLAFVKSVTKQTLLGLKFLNDTLPPYLKTENILLKLPAETADIDQYLAEHPAQTYLPHNDAAQAQSPDSVATVLSQPLPYLSPNPAVDHVDICLSDFGPACRLGQINSSTLLQTPDILQAPEQVLGQLWSGSVGVWVVGCMIFEILAGVNPFQDGTEPHSEEAHFVRMYDLSS